MNHTIKVLLIEDKRDDAELELRELKRAGISYQSRVVDNEMDLRKVLSEYVPDIVLSDFSLAGAFDGMVALEVCRELAPNVPFMFVSGTIGEERAIESLKRGATDYILKTNLKRLSSAVVRALEENETELARRKAEKEIEEQWAFFRKVLNIDRNMIFVKDNEGRFVLVNQSVADVFGTTVENMIGRTNSDFIPDQKLVEKYHQDEQEVINKQKEIFIPEIKIRDASGAERWLQVVMRPITSVDGKSQMVLAVSSDITEHKNMENDLRRNVERFELVSRATNDAVWDWDMINSRIWWNISFADLFGYNTNKEGTDVDFWVNLIHPQDKQFISDSLEEFFNSKRRYWSEEYRFQRYDGSYAFVYDRGYVIRDEKGKPVRMIGAIMDITERYEQEKKINRLNRIREVMSGINYMIVRVRDRETLFREACKIAVEQGGFAVAWVGMHEPETDEIRAVASHGDDKGLLNLVRFCKSADKPEGQNLISRSLRENRPIVSDNVANTTGMRYQREVLERGFQSFAILPLEMEGKVVGLLTFYGNDVSVFDDEVMKLLRDMTSNISFALAHIEKEKRINFLANYDVLTGLPNRELFDDRLEHALRSVDDKNQLGLLLIDIERFSYINEVFGRSAGDDLLKDIATYLKQVLKDKDHIARISGDRFAILLVGLKGAPELARFLEDKLTPALSLSLAVGSQQIRISFRAGLAITPGDGLDSEVLIKNAEAALKIAKHSSDKYLFYSPSMNALVSENLTLENKLRYALEKDEFILFYQPKVDLQTSSITGLEALIRWNSDTGLVPPYKFIPLLESTGLIVDVGLWVIKRAVEDARQWLDKGIAVPPIAVNISPMQLKASGFIDQVSAVLGMGKRIYNGLEMEITETVIMEDFDNNINKLHALRGKGVNISIDDFGTGYSSLRYMSKLPVNMLKIDRSFIINLVDNREDQAIVTAIISLAHSLNQKVIAEGVETVEQMELLKQMQCDQFQGYLFSPPVPFKEIETIMQEHSHCV